ncbi:uncharacterized protein [Rutidosis leptorrhynchoides]|uniref:uncharacterized protein n=1 Tax=Rutidosis leptorrhynchoides TaxID=125765 RepID=UPI003A992819
MSLLKESQHLKIPLKEIELATKNFQLCIGKGGYGMVYKGELSVNGKLTTVAVKRLNEQFGQGLKEFLMEIQLLTGQKHPNLITLLGYCDEGKEKIIVYEYAERGSLDQYLKHSGTVYSLTWLERLKICLDAARGLSHLHNHVGKHQTIIHRDIKSANILIDHNWVAKISDLGLSKLSLAGLNRSAVITHACGTHGYLEPEYASSGIVKKESDVYSFGMVLFEVLCGRLCLIMGDDGLLLSASLVKKCYKENKLDKIVDPVLRDRMSLDSMNGFSKIAYECLLDDREQRPPMDRVAKELEEILKMQLLSTSALETSLKISNKPEYLSVGSSSASLKETTDVINTLDAGVNDKAIMSFDLGNEETQFLLKMNQDLVNSAVDSKRRIWKNQELFDLVDEFFKNNSQTLDLCLLLKKCLKRVQYTRLLIIEALQQYHNECDGDDDNDNRSFENTSRILKKLKAAEDPFSQDFFNNFNFVHDRQKTFLTMNAMSRWDMDTKRDQWTTKVFTSLSKNYKNDIEGQQGVIHAMLTGCHSTLTGLDNIRTLVQRVQIQIESFKKNAELATTIDDTVKLVMDAVKKTLESLSKDEEELEIKTNNCSVMINKARSEVLKNIIGSPSSQDPLALVEAVLYVIDDLKRIYRAKFILKNM